MYTNENKNSELNAVAEPVYKQADDLIINDIAIEILKRYREAFEELAK